MLVGLINNIKIFNLSDDSNVYHEIFKIFENNIIVINSLNSYNDIEETKNTLKTFNGLAIYPPQVFMVIIKAIGWTNRRRQLLLAIRVN